MRHQDQHNHDGRPEVVKSEPVPVPGRPDGGQDPDLVREGGQDPDLVRDDGGPTDDDADRRPEFHPPAPVPTAFGAPTVGGAVAASALASGDPAKEPDPREDKTVRPGDGAVEAAVGGQPDAASAGDQETRIPQPGSHGGDGGG